MTDRPTLLAVGELLAEFIAVGPDGTPIDAAREAPRLYAGPFPSGAPAIAIDQAARCGARAAVFGAVGADLFGQSILDRLREGGTDVSGVTVARDRPTGTAHVAYRGDGSRSFVFHIEGSAAEEVTIGPVPPGAVLLVSGSTLGLPSLRAAVLDAAQRVVEAGGALAVDPNVRPELMGDAASQDALNALLDNALYATPSENDLAAMMPGASLTEGLAALRARGVQTVAVTRGAKGAVVQGDGPPISVAGHTVAAVDPTGAGDAFFATLVALHQGGASLEDAAHFANAAGALATTRLGPMEGNTSLRTLQNLLNAPPR